MPYPPVRAALPFLAVLALAACGPRTAEPGQAGGAPGTAPAAEIGGPRFTEADAAFVQGMLAHHAQALVMTDLAEARTDTRAIRLLAERIDVSQRDEIRMMQGWLRARGQEVPDVAGGHGHHPAHHAAAPGMLTQEQLDRLAASEGAEFDRLFLEYMIQHHQGALVMVEELFATPAAGQEVDIFRIASEIASDQQIEIQRMQRMLAAIQ